MACLSAYAGAVVAPRTHKSHKINSLVEKSGTGALVWQNALIYSLLSLQQGALCCKHLHHVWLPQGNAQCVGEGAAPVMGQALSAQVHRGQSLRGTSETVTSTKHTGPPASETTYRKALYPFAHMQDQDQPSVTALFPLVRTS